MRLGDRGRQLALVALLVVYIGLAVGYSFADPLYESPDELRHVRYVRHIAEHGSLPIQRDGGPRAQSHHPPLYYAMGALASSWVHVDEDVYYQPKENPFWGYRYWEVGDDNKTQYVHGPYDRIGLLAIPELRGITLLVYVVRWMTVLMGAGVVWLTYRIGLRVLPKFPGLALGGAALVAFNPQFLYLSGAVNNDIPAALCGAATLLVCVRSVQGRPGWRTNISLGVLFGLGLLTKIHLIVLLVPIELVYALSAWEERDWQSFMKGNLVIVGLAVLISGWWFARNQILYGDPLGVGVHSELWNSRSPSEGLWALRQEIPYLWSTLWGRFGYGQVALPRAIYQGASVFCLLCLGGFLVGGWKALPSLAAGSLAATVLVFLAWVIYYTLVQPAGARGRFLFPALPAFTVLLMAGLRRLVPWRRGWIASLGVVALVLPISLYALMWVLVPAFAPPRRLRPSEIDAIPNPIEKELRLTTEGADVAVARLRGYRVAPREVVPGDVVEVTLYWEALAQTQREHVVFVHLLSESGVMVAQRDTYPGLGRYPTSAWRPGAIIADTYRLHLPETAYTPDRGTIQVGLYVQDGPRLTTPEGQDALELATIDVHARPGDRPNPISVNFGDKLELIGYSLDGRAVEPGETVGLTLYWRALSSMDVNYEVFVHVLGTDDQIWANSDSPLTDQAVCTNRWESGVVVREERDLTLAQETPLGFYDLELGLRAPDRRRLKILGDHGRALANRTLLTKIRVVADE